jgi:hypothetical protein
MVAAFKQLERVGTNRVEGVPISSAVEVVANAMPRLNLTLPTWYGITAVTSTPFMHDCKKHEVSNSESITNAIFSPPKV